jgi:predicted DNA-binding transcriptional regulator YafY
MPYLPGVAQAVRHERRIKITYERSRGHMVTRSVDPLGLVNKAGWWYLVGHANQNISVFRVSRLHKVDQLDDPFRHPKDFDLASFWSEWTEDFERTRPKVQVLVRVSPNLAHALPEIFGESVRPLLDTAESDEQGWKKLRLSFESLKAAQYRLMGLGTEAEILEPLELRSAVAESAKRIAEFYAVSRSLGPSHQMGGFGLILGTRTSAS